MKRECRECLTFLPEYKFGGYTDRVAKKIICKDCEALLARNRRRTPEGFIQTVYQNQIKSSRKRGHQMPTYTYKELFEWASKGSKFNSLFEKYILSGCKKSFAPSFDRINDNKGYSLDNINIMTWRGNNTKAGRDMRIKKINVGHKTVIQYDNDDNIISEFPSASSAARHLNGSQSHISSVCRGERQTHLGYKFKYKKD